MFCIPVSGNANEIIDRYSIELDNADTAAGVACENVVYVASRSAGAAIHADRTVVRECVEAAIIGIDAGFGESGEAGASLDSAGRCGIRGHRIDFASRFSPRVC